MSKSNQFAFEPFAIAILGRNIPQERNINSAIELIGVMGVPRFYEDRDLRMSYVTWQEEINPFLVVELLSPSTQREDLGQTQREKDEPPTKWQVYEQFLRVPYYIVYERERDSFRAFQLAGSRYREIVISNNQLWLEELGLGLRLWQGSYEGAERLWLRFCDETGNLIPTRAERAERELQQLRDRLQAMGLDPDRLPG